MSYPMLVKASLREAGSMTDGARRRPIPSYRIQDPPNNRMPREDTVGSSEPGIDVRVASCLLLRFSAEGTSYTSDRRELSPLGRTTPGERSTSPRLWRDGPIQDPYPRGDDYHLRSRISRTISPTNRRLHNDPLVTGTSIPRCSLLFPLRGPRDRHCIQR